MYCVVRRDSDEQRCDAVRCVPAKNSPAQARETLTEIMRTLIIFYFNLTLNTLLYV